MNFKQAEKSSSQTVKRPQTIKNGSSQDVSSLGGLQTLAHESPQVKQLMDLKKIVQKKSQKTEAPSASGDLPTNLQAGIEQLSGLPMSDVQVNYNSEEPSKVGAAAYAQGSSIHLGPGQEKHLPHEAWHVVQQKKGKVSPTTSVNGMPVNDNVSLEKEADQMGNKALGLGKSNSKILQKVALNRNEKHIIQKNEGDEATEKPAETPAVEEALDPVLIEKLNTHKGLIAMAKNANAIVNDSDLWNAVTAQTDYLGATAIAGGLAGTVTDKVSQGTGVIKKLKDGDASVHAEQIASGVGSIIQDLFGMIASIKSLVASFKGSDPMQNPKIAREIMSTVQLGLKNANTILKFVNGQSIPGISAIVPGLGIAISAADIMINLHNSLEANSAESEMAAVSSTHKAQLTAMMGGEPEKKASGIFDMESRGKVFHKKSYLRLRPGIMEELAQIASGDNPDGDFDDFKTKYNLPSSLSFGDFYPAVRSYELGSKLEEINQKRKVHGGNKIFTSLLSIAGNIASFFPADGGITAASLQGASAAISGGLAGGKFIQNVARDNGWFGADETRSSASKHKEYVQHTKTIYMILAQSGLEGKDEMSLEPTQIDQLKPAEAMIKAAGASPAAVYQTNYSDKSSVLSQIKLIVESMKQGR